MFVTKQTHVFTLTTDPWGAGVGISREYPSKHPPYMTGQGTLQPVEALFRLAREANPQLKTVGVVWNSAEANSEASTVMARKICQELDIELKEVTVDSSSAVSEATKALVARQVEAIWAGGDSTVATAFDSLVRAARDGGIPVFTNMPSDVKSGAMFCLGADYYEVGFSSGSLASRILRGQASTADTPVENLVPKQLAINKTVSEEFPAWRIPKSWLARAQVVVDASGVHEQKRTRSARPVEGRQYRIAVTYFAPNLISRATLEGLRQRLSERGFVEGKNLTINEAHAQGDLSVIPSLLQMQDQSDADLIVTLTTPCLTAASATVKSKPVVFTEVYDPIAAGAGRSAEDHLPHITGVGSFPPLARMTNAMQQLVPNLRVVGVAYNNSEANSRKAISVARKLFADRSLQLEEVTVTSTNEVVQAAQVLLQKESQVLWEFGDNTAFQGVEGWVRPAQQARVPIVIADAESVTRGAVLGIGISFDRSGYAAGDLAARVLLGERTSSIPFEEVAVVRMGANLEMAANIGLSIPVSLLKHCDYFHGVRQRYGRAARVALLQLTEGTTLDSATDGVLDGLKEAGLQTDRDIVVKKYNAQGDLSQLPLMLASIKDQETDLIITSTTPAMIAAANATRDIPIVFTVASYPPAVGVFAEGNRQPNVVGVYDDPPIQQLIDLAMRRESNLNTVGTVWNPAEPNSGISVKKLRLVCKENDLKLLERHAASVTEVRDATAAACLAGAQIILISADNVTSSGLPAILSVTKPQGIPIYSTEPDMVRRGAAAAIGDDYYEWGKQSGRLAAKVLAGVPPNEIPFEKTAIQRTVTQEDVK